ncbi:MAG: hypothetical protein U0359_31580 [Byssovorax sp.]
MSLSISAGIGLLVPFGCGVDHRPPALTGGQTVTVGTLTTTGAGGSGGAGGHGGGGSSSSAGAGPSTLCECAKAAFTGEGSSCAVCLKQAAAVDHECASQGIDCGAGAACAPVVICLAGCIDGGGPSCVSDCLYPAAPTDANQKYLAFLACACDRCGSFCATPEPVVCMPAGPPDGGASDGAGGGG